MNSVDDILFRSNCGQLRMFNCFDDAGTAEPFVYDFGIDSLTTLRQQYDIQSLISNDEIQTSLRVLRWVNQHVYHNGNENQCKNHALSILNYAYDSGLGVSCFHQSIVLCEALLALRIYARILHMMPLNPYDFDSHVVVMVYIATLGKWIMLDPTHQCYCMNDAGDLLGPMEIRNRISMLKGIICEELMYNGRRIDAHAGANARAMYYAKNMFYFYTSMITTYGSEFFFDNEQMPDGQKNYYLAPSGFDPVDHEATKARYCMSQGQNDSSWNKHLSFIEETKDRRIKVRADTFFGAPIRAAI